MSAPPRSGRVDLPSGQLLDDVPDLDRHAIASQTLLANDADWGAIFGRLGGFEGSAEVRDVVVISPRSIHVALRAKRHDLALVCVGEAGPRVGLVVAEARSALAKLDESEGGDGGRE